MSIQSEINRLNAAKAELKTSIENGGVTVSLNAKIDAYPALVDAITQQVKDKVDAINGEVVEGDVDAKLNKITSTKTDLAAALAEKGQTVGDVFSTYGDAVRAIKTGGEIVEITFNQGGRTITVMFTDADDNNANVIFNGDPIQIFVKKNTYVVAYGHARAADVSPYTYYSNDFPWYKLAEGYDSRLADAGVNYAYAFFASNDGTILWGIA